MKDVLKDYPLVSVVIPTYNRKEKLIRLLDSIFHSEYPSDKIEINIVDDASSDGTSEAVKSKFNVSNLRIIRNSKNRQVAAARNSGISKSQGEYIFFLDDDVVISCDTISQLIKSFKENGNGNIVGPLIYQSGKDNIIWSAGVKINFWTTIGKFIYQGQKDKGQLDAFIESDALPTSFMIHRSLLEKTGLFNESLFPWAFEEIDFCIRAKLQQSKVFVVSAAKIWHEREKGSGFDNAKGLYFGARNRLIAHKLWSKNWLQFIVSRICSIFFILAYMVMKTTIYRNNYKECMKYLFRGLFDGIRMSNKVEFYSVCFKKQKSIKYSMI